MGVLRDPNSFAGGFIISCDLFIVGFLFGLEVIHCSEQAGGQEAIAGVVVVGVGSNVLELNMHKEARGIKFYGGALRIKEFTRNCCDLQEEMHWRRREDD